MPDSFNNYYEPFIGGDTLLLFEIKPEKAIINDYNEELINTYKCIKNNDKLELMLSSLDDLAEKHNETLYYEIRSLDKDKVWFTDGIGWLDARKNLEETFNVLDTLYNINDLDSGIITTG